MSKKYHLADNPEVDLAKENIRLKDGTRLTDEIAAGIAAEALSKSAVGRPSLTAPGQRSPSISFRVPDDVREAVEQLATSEGKTISQVAREALEDYVTHR